jgi:serpin B
MANFLGMDETGNLFISKVIHKAFVDVNEEGTEATAATAALMVLRSKRVSIARPVVVFYADHPFLFVIRHNPSGSLLFWGKLVNPLV